MINKKLTCLGFSSLLALSACGASAGSNVEETTSTDSAAATVAEQTTVSLFETLPEPVQTTPTEVAEKTDWESFWEEFQTAIADEDANKVAALSVDPLPLGETGDSLDQATILADYDKYFADPQLKTLFTRPANQIEQLEMIEKFSERYNAATGETVYQVVLKIDNISQTYVFGDESGEFKLRSLILLQH